MFAFAKHGGFIVNLALIKLLMNAKKNKLG